MGYRLIITERTEQLLDNCVQYLLYQLKNSQAAAHLLGSIERIYDQFCDARGRRSPCVGSFLLFRIKVPGRL